MGKPNRSLESVERRREYDRQYRKDHPRMYWDINKLEADRKYKREWSRENRKDPVVASEGSKKTREWQINNPVHNAITSYKKGARNRELDWDLSDEDAIILILGECYYCGSLPDPVNGIDRVDNEKGYYKDNVVTACKICNCAKKTLTLIEFKEWVVRIANKFGKGE